MEIKTVKKDSCYTCGVCGDTASCYKLYGTTNVCHSCRIFFRRTVKAKRTLTCIIYGSASCNFDKFTRNRCRSCRYSKCLAIGMNPNLVDSCKQVEQHSDSGKSEISLQPITSSVTTASIKNNIIQVSISPKTFNNFLKSKDYLPSECTKEKLILKYEEIQDNVCLHPLGEYMTKLFKVEKSFYEQALLHKNITVFPIDYISSSKKVLDSVALPFLGFFLPEVSADSLKKIASNTSMTLLGLYSGLELCFSHESMLDQLHHSYIASPACQDFLRQSFPDIENIKALPMEEYDMKSPWATKIEDEELVDNTFEILYGLVNGDEEVAKLLILLALFSPVKISLNREETFCLKQFQSKISIMLYSHLLSKDTFDNISALERVSKLGKIIENMNKCGEIFHDGIIYHDDEDNLVDIETIDIVELFDIM